MAKSKPKPPADDKPPSEETPTVPASDATDAKVTEAMQVADDWTPPVPEEPPLPTGTFRLRLRKQATIGQGTRERGEVLGLCHCAPGVEPADVVAAVADPRFIQEVAAPEGVYEFLTTLPAHGRRVGEPLFAVQPAPGYNVRECVNALRNPGLIGL